MTTNLTLKRHHGGFLNHLVHSATVYGRAALAEVQTGTSLVVHSLEHAVEQPIAGMVGVGKQAAQSAWYLFSFGGNAIHIVVGLGAGFLGWRLLRTWSPVDLEGVEQTMESPLKRMRLL